MPMTTQQINKAIDQEIWKMRDNEEAMRKMLDAARQIRILYVTPSVVDSSESEQEKDEERKSDEELLRELRAIPYELPWTVEEYKKMIRDSRTYLPREHKPMHDEG